MENDTNNATIVRWYFERDGLWSDVASEMNEAESHAIPSVNVAATVVSEQSVERINRHNAALVDIQRSVGKGGWAPAATAVTFGARVVDIGDENFRISRSRFEDKPLAIEGLNELIASQRAENRDSVMCELGDLRPTEDGRWYLDGSAEGEAGAVPMTRIAYTRLCAQLDAPSRPWLSALVAAPSDMLPVAWDRWRKSADQTVKGKAVRVGVRELAGEAQVYSVWSGAYSNGDGNVQGHEMAALVQEILPTVAGGDQYRLEAKYNPDTTSVRLTFLRHAQEISNLSAGDGFKGGFTLKTNDAGGGGLSGHTDVWRNLCYNMIIIAHEKVGRRSVRHVGDIKEQVREVIETTINQTTSLLTGFASDWGIVMNTPIRKVFGTDDIRKVMNEIARSKAFDPLGIARDSAVEVLVGGWEDERETNLAAIVNAITAAHKRVAVDKVPEWEAAGGKVLKQLVMQAQA